MFGIGPMELILVMAFGLNLGVPLGMPPLPPDPVMQRVAPDKCLYYLSCSGTTVPDAKSPNQTEQLLAEDEIQDFFKQLDAQLNKAVQHAAKRDPRQAAILTELPAILKTLLLRPSAAFLTNLEIQPNGGPPLVEGGLVVDAGDTAAELRASLLKVEAAALAAANGKPQEVEVADVTFHRLPTPPGTPDILWVVGKRHLMVTVGKEAAAALISRMKDSERKTPGWLSEVTQRLPVERVSLVSYVNVAAALEIVKPLVRDPHWLKLLDVSGLAAVRSISSVAGFQGEGVLSQSWIDCGGKPAGILNLISDKPLAAADLKPIPSDVTTAFAVRLSLADADQNILTALGQIDPDAQGKFVQGRNQLEAQLDIKLQDDLLKPLGDVIAIINAPAEAGSFLTGVGLTISLQDRERLAKTEDRLLMLAKAFVGMRGGENGPTIKSLPYKGDEIHVVKLGPGVPFSPAWCLSKDHLIVGLSPQFVKAILNPRPRAQSLAEVDAVAKLLHRPRGPSAISFQDTEQILTLLYGYAQLGLPMVNQQLAKQNTGFEFPDLPTLSTIKAHLRPNVAAMSQVKDGWLIDRTQTLPMIGDATAIAPVGIALLLPAVQSARSAARRSVSINNVQQLTLATLNYETVHGQFPAAAICDKQGKPLLSWRVSVLPYLEESQLYNQFHLDEPWDSEHNLKLIESMPQTYRNPDAENIDPGKTMYLTVTGKHAVSDVKSGRKASAIVDGTSKTILLVEARPDRAVVWTKPDDLPLDDQILKALRGARQGGFIAAFVDGSVRLIEDSVPDKVLKPMFTIDGGEQEAEEP